MGTKRVAKNIKQTYQRPRFRQRLLNVADNTKALSIRALEDKTIKNRELRLALFSFSSEVDYLIDYVQNSSFVKDDKNNKSGKLAKYVTSLRNNISKIESTYYSEKSIDFSHPIMSLIVSAGNLINILDSYLEHVSNRPEVSKEIDLILEIPTELPAPIRIAITEDRISLTAPKHKSGPLTDKSIDTLRRSACGILEELIEELSQPTSNADRRLNPRLKSLLRELSVPLPDMAVEAVGLQWQVTSDVIAATHETVPDALLPQIQRILSTIRNLLAQFDEWHEYEAVTITETIKPGDTQELAQIGNEIAAEIAAKTEVIDSQIGDRLHDMALALSNGLVRQETLAAPIVGSLSNFFAGISQFILERGAFIINPAVEIGMTATDPITLGRSVILLSVCAFIMNRFAPRLMEYAPFSWLKTIQPTALKYYSALSKTGRG